MRNCRPGAIRPGRKTDSRSPDELMTDKSLFAEMTWPEVRKAVGERRVVLIPIGAIEQHGRHLPVDTDNVFAEEICGRAAERAPDAILSVPPIHYGFNDHNMDFPGTISVKMQHFIDYCFDVAASLAHQGFRRIILVNAHGSNGRSVSSWRAGSPSRRTHSALVSITGNWPGKRSSG